MLSACTPILVGVASPVLEIYSVYFYHCFSWLYHHVLLELDHEEVADTREPFLVDWFEYLDIK